MTRRVDKGRAYTVTDHYLAVGHSMHDDGMSVRAVARWLLAEGHAFAASEKSLTATLTNAWRARGWAVRSQSEATAASNLQRGFRPRCSHVHAAGPSRGERCARRCVGNDSTCWHHDPQRIAAGIARLRGVAA